MHVVYTYYNLDNEQVLLDIISVSVHLLHWLYYLCCITDHLSNLSLLYNQVLNKTKIVVRILSRKGRI